MLNIQIRVPARPVTGSSTPSPNDAAPSSNMWFAVLSAGGFMAQPWGLGTDSVAPGDYDDDGRADRAVYRPSDGTWRLELSNGGSVSQPWGLATDIPALQR